MSGPLGYHYPDHVASGSFLPRAADALAVSRGRLSVCDCRLCFPESPKSGQASGRGQSINAGAHWASRVFRRNADLGPHRSVPCGPSWAAEWSRKSYAQRSAFTLFRKCGPRFVLDKECVHSLLHFGKWILIGTALTFLATQSDRLILGKLITIEALGVYGVAFALSDMPRQIIMMFCSRVGYPFIARYAQSPRKEYRSVFIKYRWPVLAVGGLGLILVICTGDQLVLHLYDHRYRAAAWMIGVLAAGLWHTMLYSTLSPAILALSKAHYNAFANLIYCVSLFTLIPLGFHYYGTLGAVAAVAVADLPVYFAVVSLRCLS